MADSTRDPLSMDTVGGRGRWVAPAPPGLGSSSPALWGARLPPVLSQRRQISPGFQEATALACPYTTNSASSPPFFLRPQLCYPSRLALVCAPTHHSLLTIYNGGHSLADAGAVMKLRVKQSGLQKAQGSRVQPHILTRHPSCAGQRTGGPEGRPAVSLCTSHSCGPQFPHV